MNELEVLRSMRSDNTQPNEDTLIRGQARLERSITERKHASVTPIQATHRARTIPKILLGSVAAAAAIGIVITTFGPSSNAPQAQASVILTEAAEHLRKQDVPLSDGQVLRIEEIHETLGEAGPCGVEADIPGSTIKYRDAETLVTIVPADLAADWTVWRSGRELVEILDGQADPNPEATVRESLANSGPGESEEIWPGGIMPGSQYDPIRRDAPTDKDTLRAYILADIAGQESSEEESIFEWLLPVLSNPAAPSELRASGFEILAELGTLTAPEQPNEKIQNVKVVSMKLGDGETRRDLVFSGERELVEVQEVLVGESSWLASLEPGTVLSSVTIDATLIENSTKANM